MATLEQLRIETCPELDGAMMEKILKLQNCYIAYIFSSKKLSEKWELMKGETEHPMVVLSGDFLRDDGERAIRVSLLHGKCMEVNNDTDQLLERSSLLVGLRNDISTTVALIMLPNRIESHQHQILQQFVEMARETTKSNGSGELQIVCARKSWGQTPTEEEERAEEEDIRQILMSLPKGSCAIPSTESKRVKILTWCCDRYDFHRNTLSFFMANLVDIEGRKRFENLKFTEEHAIRKPPPSQITKPKSIRYNRIQNFIESICSWQSQCVAGESKTREFMEALKAIGIHYLPISNNTSQVMVDDLHGKAIGFIICDFKFLECIKLQQIYKDLQEKDSNFIAIWMPTLWPGDCGHGTYTRLVQCMPWATFPHSQLVNVTSRDPRFVLLDEHGQIAHHDALSLLLAWGVKSYPFTWHTIPQIFYLMESETCLELLLHGMNIVGRKLMKSKMTFLYAAPPRECHKMNSIIEELTQIHGSFEVLYVGRFYDVGFDDIEYLKQEYEDAVQDMRWPSLSFSDMISFWYRCEYMIMFWYRYENLASNEGYELNNESKIMMEKLHGLAKWLSDNTTSLLLLDNDGVVTCSGYDVLQIIYDEISEGEGMTMRMVKDELMKNLSRGECSSIIKTFFRDEIDNLPQHPQHPIVCSTWVQYYICNVCFRWMIPGWNQMRSYRCWKCKWDMCGSCWMAYAKQQFEHCQR